MKKKRLKDNMTKESIADRIFTGDVQIYTPDDKKRVNFPSQYLPSLKK